MADVKSEVELQSLDASRFISISEFQNRAHRIDPIKNHNWKSVISMQLDYDGGERQILVGDRFDRSENKSFGLLVAFKDKDRNIGFQLDNIPNIPRGRISHALRDVALYVPYDKKSDAIVSILELSKKWDSFDNDTFSENITKVILGFIPDETSSSGQVLPRFVEGNNRTTAENIAKVNEMLGVVAHKLESDGMNTLIKKIDDIVYFNSDLVNDHLPYLYSVMLDSLYEANSNIRPDYRSLSKGNTDEFKPNLYARQYPQTEEELVSIFVEQPKPKAEPINLLRARVSDAEALMVPLDKVVGGRDVNTFLLKNASEGRGPVKILELIRGYKQGRGLDPKEPIQVYEYKGEYWVGNDGNHRVSAMKAMGIPLAPMLVQHVVED